MNDNDDQRNTRDTSNSNTDTEEAILYHSANNRPLAKRKVMKSAFGKYGLWIGTLQWQTRSICVTRTDPIFGEAESFELETYINLLPAQWLLKQNISLRLSRTGHGWNHNIRYFPRVPNDALIFKYCRDGNLDGVRDLIKYGMASPWDVDILSYTPLHVSQNQMMFLFHPS